MRSKQLSPRVTSSRVLPFVPAIKTRFSSPDVRGSAGADGSGRGGISIVKRAEPMSRHFAADSRMYSRIFVLVIPIGVPMLGSYGIGVAAPEDKESLLLLRVPSLEVIVLLATLKILLPLPENLRSAEIAEFIVPTEDWLPAIEPERVPFER